MGKCNMCEMTKFAIRYEYLIQYAYETRKGLTSFMLVSLYSVNPS